MAKLRFIITGVVCLISLCNGDSIKDATKAEVDVELPAKDELKKETVDIDISPLKAFIHRTKDLLAKGQIPGLEGKNVVGMMDKIEGILKSGVKHAVPVETHKRQNNNPFPPVEPKLGTYPGGTYPSGTYPSGTYPSGTYPSGYHKEGSHHGGVSPAEAAQNAKDKDYKPFKFAVKEHNYMHKYHDKDLDLYDLKNIWLSMLNDVYQILQDENILKDAGTNVKTLEKIFLLLWDIDLVEPRRKEDLKCPYGFNQAGDMCLSAEFINEKLKWEDARLYCQVVKGGDLVVFKNACEFRTTIEFLYEIDKKRKHSYWVGASDLDKEGFWKYVDGSNVERGAGLWGTRLGALEPSGGDEQDLGILLASDYWYMHDINDYLARKKLNVIPLCQYIPERDGFVVIPTKPTGVGPYAAYDDDIKDKYKDKDAYKGQKGYQTGPGYHQTGPGGYQPGSEGYQPGSGGYQPGSGGYQPGSGGYQPGSGGYQPGSGGYQPGPGGYMGGASPYERKETKTKSSPRIPREFTDSHEVRGSLKVDTPAIPLVQKE